MNGLILSGNVKTMSSRDMAKITDKPHDNVLKVIRGLIADGIVKNTTPHDYVHDQNKQTYTEYLSDKRDSLVIVARLSPEYTAAIVDRWQELEAQANPFKIPTTLHEALRLAADQSEALSLANEQIALAAPKVDYYEKVVVRDHLLNATQVAQKVGMSAMQMNRCLDGLKVYNKTVKRSRAFQVWFMDNGYGEVKQTEAGFPQPMFTLAGEAWIIQKFTSEGLI